ncbi:helix-turn-helix transcriptional regulator [Hoeflea sp. G2-23]|uniref:Helix-turn-helix transcriptional regulator n=1 Tax=Hoeflea algicola TaxID=2983763 RepID=A0ABT3Z5I2_9HYPH|nr:helix-turn-helix transcriptional regulator [Hoeflea algicola]MCY0147028.1 helix-turn-helix transcriptional regulator [Hoeflea algicola]
MLKPEAAFHLGPELERALNRMDFFRLFKALTGNHGYQYFAFAEVLGEEDAYDLNLPHSLHNIPDAWIDGGIGQNDPLVEHLRGSTVACSMDAQSVYSVLCRQESVHSVVVVPLHTAVGKRFGLLMLGNAQRPRHDQLAVIAHDAAVVFQRYFEAILSLDTISGLNDREIQIVRWTSEGKTSAEIAIILGLSEHTVNSYIAAILRKLHVVNRAQMVASALRSGLIN